MNSFLTIQSLSDGNTLQNRIKYKFDCDTLQNWEFKFEKLRPRVSTIEFKCRTLKASNLLEHEECGRVYVLQPARCRQD
jgi:hypothetical protein